MRKARTPRMGHPALRHLSKADPAMRKLIRGVGPCTPVPQRRHPPYETLVRAIAHQQLNGRAAQTILDRFIALFPGKRFPEPDDIRRTSTGTLRRAGFSRAKIRAIKHIALRAAAGAVPTRRRAARMSDDDLIGQLTQLRGVGPWTVQMLLMFTLGRPDVLPADDFGIREGFRITYGLRKQPTPRQVLRHGERWRPYRTVASWYLWRAVERARDRERSAAK
jgi:DNA-3-methyladenine glycosylase II